MATPVTGWHSAAGSQHEYKCYTRALLTEECGDDCFSPIGYPTHCAAVHAVMNAQLSCRALRVRVGHCVQFIFFKFVCCVRCSKWSSHTPPNNNRWFNGDLPIPVAPHTCTIVGWTPFWHTHTWRIRVMTDRRFILHNYDVCTHTHTQAHARALMAI